MNNNALIDIAARRASREEMIALLKSHDAEILRLLQSNNDLLSALQGFIGGMTDDEIDTELVITGGYLSMSVGAGIVNAARAAIAKATSL